MPIQIDIDVNLIEKAEFCFSQNGVTRIVTYPEDPDVSVENGVFMIDWTAKDSSSFKSCIPVNGDVRITLIGTKYQPETEAFSFIFKPSLFEVDDNEN